MTLVLQIPNFILLLVTSVLSLSKAPLIHGIDSCFDAHPWVLKLRDRQVLLTQTSPGLGNFLALTIFLDCSMLERLSKVRIHNIPKMEQSKVILSLCELFPSERARGKVWGVTKVILSSICIEEESYRLNKKKGEWRGTAIRDGGANIC